jgi:hypothetical protein
VIQTPKAILLDSGGVLMRPIGGRWNPRADFESTVKLHAPHVTDEQLAEAVREGDRFMAAVTSTPDRHDYHRAMLTHIGVEAPPELLAAAVRLGYQGLVMVRGGVDAGEAGEAGDVPAISSLPELLNVI